MCETVSNMKKIKLYDKYIDREELIEVLTKFPEFKSPSLPKLSIVIEEIKDENAQPNVTAPKPKRKSCWNMLKA